MYLLYYCVVSLSTLALLWRSTVVLHVLAQYSSVNVLQVRYSLDLLAIHVANRSRYTEIYSCTRSRCSTLVLKSSTQRRRRCRRAPAVAQAAWLGTLASRQRHIAALQHPSSPTLQSHRLSTQASVRRRTTTIGPGWTRVVTAALLAQRMPVAAWYQIRILLSR